MYSTWDHTQPPTACIPADAAAAAHEMHSWGIYSRSFHHFPWKFSRQGCFSDWSWMGFLSKTSLIPFEFIILLEWLTHITWMHKSYIFKFTWNCTNIISYTGSLEVFANGQQYVHVMQNINLLIKLIFASSLNTYLSSLQLLSYIHHGDQRSHQQHVHQLHNWQTAGHTLQNKCR